MQRVIFTISFFFLSACSAVGTDDVCPQMVMPRSYVIDYAYGRTDINASAFEKMTAVAEDAAAAGKRICIVGRTGHANAPREDLALSLSRAQRMMSVFSDAGVPRENLYLIVQPQDEAVGEGSFSDSFKVDRRVVVVVGK